MSTDKTTTKPAAMHRRFEGVVVSDRGQKTIQVLVKTQKLHKKYRKHYTTSKKYAVHDEKGEAHTGDTVMFQECRPLSKTKRWRLVKVVSQAR